MRGKKNMIRLGLLLGIAIAVSAILGLAEGSPGIGAHAPRFSLPGLDGKVYSLAEVTRAHRVTLVNFWATWCPPCRREVPELNAFYRAYKKRGVTVLAVNLKEARATVKAFAAKEAMPYPVLLDGAGKTASAYGVYAIPATYILDRRGVVRDIVIGGTTDAALRAKVQRLLR